MNDNKCIFNVIDWQSLDFTVTTYTKHENGETSTDKEKRFLIRAFGRNRSGKSVCLNINGYKPLFYLRFTEDDFLQKNNFSTLNHYLNSLRRKIIVEEDTYLKSAIGTDDYEDEKRDKLNDLEEIWDNDLDSIGTVHRVIYDYFRNDIPNKFYSIKFKSKRGFNLFKKVLNRQKNVTLYETNIDPLFRFFHERNIQPTGWIECASATKSTNWTVSRCDLEFKCANYKSINVKNCNFIAPFRIASFDIECTSEDGSFPQAYRENDKIIQIGITTHLQGDKIPYEYCMITLGPCADLDERTNVDNKLLIICENEKELLLKFTEYFNNLDPDIITGYNIWGFDWKYMYDRAVLFKIQDKFLKMSRITYETNRYVEKSLSSSALGDNLLKYIEITGVVQIDMFKLIQKDYNLSSYKLNSVSSHFLQGKAEINFENNTVLTNSVDGIFVDNQISFIDQYENYVKEGFKFTITDITDNIITLKEDLKPYFKLHNEDIIEEFTAQNHDFKKYPIVLKYNWCENKIDLPPDDIFNNFKKGTAESIREIGVYCIKDCILCNSLIVKLEVITKNMGMSNVCTVPLSYLFLRGQSVKIFSVVAKECQTDGFIIPVITKDSIENDTSYEGAIVLPPKIGIYFEPVAVMDYSSLYPSSMISDNISHDTLVKVQLIDINRKLIKEYGTGVDNPELLNLTDKYWYKQIEYNNYDGDKNIIGYTICSYVQPKSNNHNDKGVLPRVLKKLLQARKDTRKEQKGYKYDDFRWGILEGLQLAYKVTCNSLYGWVGASTSQGCKKELAASTTAVGRELLEMARDMTISHYKGSECVYGDSILGDEPLLLKLNGKIFIKTIETITDTWKSYEGFKVNDSNRKEKEQSICDYMIWTNNKWSTIKRVIRHKTNKKIYRVNTHSGVIDVTEDHSLLNANMEIIKPSECKEKETELLQSYPKFNEKEPLHLNEIMDILDKYESYERTIDEKEAFIYGVFYGDGSCGKYNTKWGIKYSWALNNKDDKLLNMCLLYLEELYGDKTKFKILNTLKSSGVQKLVPFEKIKCIVDLFRPLFYDKNKLKIIPDKIINSNYNIRLNFFLGYYFADGSKCRNSNTKHITFDNKGKIGSSQLYYLVKSLNYDASIKIRKDKPDIYRISCCCLKTYKNKQRVKSNIIKKIEHLKNIDDNIYVYDLETEEGCFNGGIGEIIVKNTDSVFIKFATKDLSEAIRLGKEAGERVTAELISQNRQPHDLEYEKTFHPFILFSKKRYVGNKYEEDVNKFKQTSMGIVLKRRDNARILKDTYQGVINSILNDKDTKKAEEFYINGVKRLLNGDVKFNKLIISKTLKGHYKNPTQIAHKILADRIKDRDPGNAPATNDRIPYIYVDKSTLKCTKCLRTVNSKINTKLGLKKCIGCTKIFCSECIPAKIHSCEKICRFCHIKIPLRDILNKKAQCNTCNGWFCKKCSHKCLKPLTEKLLQGDIIEDPEYLEANKDIKPDFLYYYEHQIQTPVEQIISLYRKDASELIKPILQEYNNKQNGDGGITSFFKMKHK